MSTKLKELMAKRKAVVVNEAAATSTEATPAIDTKPVITKPTKPIPKPTGNAELLAKLKERALKKQSDQLSAKTKSLANQSDTSSTSDLLAKYRSADKLNLELPDKSVTDLVPSIPEHHRVEKHEITLDDLNDQQKLAVEYAVSGKSYSLVGAAGSGKSTTQRIVLQQLADSGAVHPLTDMDHKHLPKNCMSIAVVSFINKAVNNIRNLLPDQFKPNAITIHKLLQYSPVEEEREYINEYGEVDVKTIQTFKPTRNSYIPIIGLTHIVVEEASTVNMDLWEKLLDALPNRGHGVCFIFLGDIKQLPPVFGQSVLAEKLQKLPYVELTQIYRQSLTSPIKKLAVAINDGERISDEVLKSDYEDGDQLRLVNLSGRRADGTLVQRVDGQMLVQRLTTHFVDMLRSGQFQPFRDVILCPYRQNHNDKDDINCEHMNALLAEADGISRDAEVHEVVAGFTKKYYAIGDPVTYNKEDYLIVNIESNPSYSGIVPKFPSTSLDRWGKYRDDAIAKLDLEVSDAATAQILDMSVVMSKAAENLAEEDRVKSASHIITLEYQTLDPNAARTETISTLTELATMDFAYCLTVHKSIGSEWDSVFLIAHNSHIRMLTRELLYTGVTRAKNHLTVYYDGHNHLKRGKDTSTINQAIVSPEIKGVTIKEKLAWLEKKNAIANEDTSNLLDKYKQG